MRYADARLRWLLSKGVVITDTNEDSGAGIPDGEDEKLLPMYYTT